MTDRDVTVNDQTVQVETEPVLLADLGPEDWFIGPDQALHEVTTPASADPRGWTVVHNLSMSDDDETALTAAGGYEDGAGPRDGFFSFPGQDITVDRVTGIAPATEQGAMGEAHSTVLRSLAERWTSSGSEALASRARDTVGDEQREAFAQLEAARAAAAAAPSAEAQSELRAASDRLEALDYRAEDLDSAQRHVEFAENTRSDLVNSALAERYPVGRWEAESLVHVQDWAARTDSPEAVATREAMARQVDYRVANAQEALALPSDGKPDSERARRILAGLLSETEGDRLQARGDLKAWDEEDRQYKQRLHEGLEDGDVGQAVARAREAVTRSLRERDARSADILRPRAAESAQRDSAAAMED